MMKKALVTTIALVWGITTGFAQQAVQIKGSLNVPYQKKVTLFKVKNGKMSEISSSRANAENNFSFSFTPSYEGIYVLSTGLENVTPIQKHLFYFKGGEQLDITLSSTSYELNGKLNSAENRVLKQWRDLSEPLYLKALNYKDNSTIAEYLSLQEEVVAKSKKLLSENVTGNAKFDSQLKDIIAMDLANYASNFLSKPKIKLPIATEYTNLFATLNAEQLAQQTAKIYSYPYGMRVLAALASINMGQNNVAYKTDAKSLVTYASYIPNDTLKGDLVLQKLGKFKSYDDYKEAADQLEKYFLTKKQKQKNESLKTALRSYKPGADGLAFSYPDKNGEAVSLASLKGKVVLVDVWATWCGPCRAEFPHLKQLEKDVEGKPIEIVSITVDSEKDKAKWLKMIKDENLGGVQLFAGQGNELSKYYQINTIPRFLVFDKNGKIVSVDAPRPSSPELKKLLFAEAAK